MNKRSVVGALLSRFALALLLSILSACSSGRPDAASGPSAVASGVDDGSQESAQQQPSTVGLEPSEDVDAIEPQGESSLAPTPLPLFGRKVEVPELFERVDQAVLGAADLYSPGVPLLDVTSAQMVDLVGFTPMQVLVLPDIFAPETTEVFPDLKSVKQCFSQYGSRPGTLPQVCVVQQPTPFEDAIGTEADVYHLETKYLYIEYVFGGWLSVGTSQDGVRSYQWDARMVPVVRLRYFSDGLFTEISCAGHECPELEELVALAESTYLP